MHDELKRRVEEHGRAAFGASWMSDGWTIAPGRIELIGNHIDYNGGPVLAAAIDRVIVMGSGPLEDPRQIALIAPDVSGEAASFAPLELGDWHSSDADTGPTVYVKGVVASLMARDVPIRTGVGLSTVGNIPPGFGMSSSAALCLATILALTVDEMEPPEMVAIAREAEHRAGSPVGAMDQSASAAGDLIVFDGRDNSYRQIRPDLDGYVFAVADSGVDRSLRTSSYRERVEESEEARKRLAMTFDLYLPNLAALAQYWDEVEPRIDGHLTETLVKRARHVVTETLRVQLAERAASEGDWESFGRLMNESGTSSAVDYEISHPVVEELVGTLSQQDGVLGARMMGGGEGGPALVLLRRDAVESVREALNARFYANHEVRGAQPFQVCSFGPGAHREAM